MKVFLRLVAVLLLSTLALSQSDEIVPNENLVVEGVPKIPALACGDSAALQRVP